MGVLNLFSKRKAARQDQLPALQAEELSDKFRCRANAHSHCLIFQAFVNIHREKTE
jgi:hypothetical protein